MAYDLYWDKVVLAMHMDGANNSTTFTDLKGATVGYAGSPVISTAQSLFGGSSALFGSNSRLLIPATSGFAFGTSDFDIAFSIFGSGLTAAKEYSIGTFTNNSGTAGWWAIAIGTGGIDFVGNGFSTVVGAATIPTNAWRHVRVKRSGTTVSIELEGVSIGSGTVASSLTVGTHLVVGAGDAAGGFGTFYTGYMDELVITKGVARPAETPSAPFPERMPQLSGVVKDNTGSFAAREVRVYRRSDKLLTSSVLSNGTTGVFAADAADTSPHFAICLDSGSENALIFDNITPA